MKDLILDFLAGALCVVLALAMIWWFWHHPPHIDPDPTPTVPKPVSTTYWGGPFPTTILMGIRSVEIPPS